MDGGETGSETASQNPAVKEEESPSIDKEETKEKTATEGGDESSATKDAAPKEQTTAAGDAAAPVPTAEPEGGEKEEPKELTEEEKAAAAKRAETAKILEEDSKYESGFMSFPEKLMTLLDGDEVNECMWWLKDGDSFCLIPLSFAEKVLDKHFQGTKFESFTRKLNRWCVALVCIPNLLLAPLTLSSSCLFVTGDSNELQVKRCVRTS